MKKVLLILVLALFAFDSNAQQSKVDSIVALLRKSIVNDKIDTSSFIECRRLINNTVLNDAQIAQIESAANPYKSRKDDGPFYLIKTNILQSIMATDESKGIAYGKAIIEELKNSKTFAAGIIKKSILQGLRIPYREAGELADGFQYYTQQLNNYIKSNDSTGMSICYFILGGFYRTIGLFESSIYNIKKSLSYIDTSRLTRYQYFNMNVTIGKGRWINNNSLLTELYLEMGDYQNALIHSRKNLAEAIQFSKSGGQGDSVTSRRELFNARSAVKARLAVNKLDSIEYYLALAEASGGDLGSDKSFKPALLQLRAQYLIKLGEYAKADSLLQACWKWVKTYDVGVNQPAGVVEPDYYLALSQIAQKNYSGAINLLLKNVQRVKNIRPNVLRDYKLLAELYEKVGSHLQAKEVLKSFISLQDSMYADQSKYRSITFETEQMINDSEMAVSKLESESKLSLQARNFSFGIALLLLVLAGSIYYRFQNKKKANLKLEKTLRDLKSTQAQLIQSEKMASLGELTAGIAHEIQNPLNFVNNFSEVSNEMIDEMNEQLDRGHVAEAKVISTDLKHNLEKINHHGKRAGSIVKGMLQHSRSSSEKKELTDLNALVDEYLRLAYHGLRAKDNAFNATLQTEYDETIGQVNVVPQDMGRVILNLITNAFYVVDEKKKSGVTPYEPTVTVSTKRHSRMEGGAGDEVRISVKDNGAGIPPHIAGKIFQPFFTTKPTGKGTGLGLSLAYDIVKAHGGELRFETQTGESETGQTPGTVFVIVLPVSSVS